MRILDIRLGRRSRCKVHADTRHARGEQIGLRGLSGGESPAKCHDLASFEDLQALPELGLASLDWRPVAPAMKAPLRVHRLSVRALYSLLNTPIA